MVDRKQNPKLRSHHEESKDDDKEEEEEEPLQAIRLKAIAEQKYASGNLALALKYAKRAQSLHPKLAGVSEVVTAFNVLNTSRQAPIDHYYKILQVERFSHINLIKKQYKMLALILHPDKNPFAASEEAFKLVGEAFRMLSDKTRRKEYDMKLRISMQAEAVVGSEEDGEKEGVETFLTSCSACRLLHKFERKYLGHNLVCPSCKKSFKAAEASENRKEGSEEEEEKDLGRTKGKKGGDVGDLDKELSKEKRKIGAREFLERLKGKKALGEDEDLRSKDDAYESASRDVENGDAVEGLRLRSGKKVRFGDEVVEKTTAKRANVGVEEMMTLAEMRTMAKRKLNEGKMKPKGTGKVEENVMEEVERGRDGEKKDRQKYLDDGIEKKDKDIEGETEENAAVAKVMEKKDGLGVSDNEKLRTFKRRKSGSSDLHKQRESGKVRENDREKKQEEGGKIEVNRTEERKEKELEMEREGVGRKEKEDTIKETEMEREKELEEALEEEKESGPETEKTKEIALVNVREKRERRTTWKFLDSFGVPERRKDKKKEKEMDESLETGNLKVKEKSNKWKTSKVESAKVVEKKKEKKIDGETEKETEAGMVIVKEIRDKRKTSKNDSTEVVKRRVLRSENETGKHEVSRQNSLEIVAIEESDFYDFDKDRVGRNFKKGQVWALYDDNDGMPRHYALVDEVVSVNPFEVRLDWLEFQNNGDERLICWEKLGFRISCGRFKVSTSLVVQSLKIFSHIADCERATKELYRIYPKKGSIWAIYNEKALDAEEGNLTAKNKSCYDIVIFLTTYSEVHGLSMAFLERVDGFRTVFQRREIGAHAIRWREREDYRLFSHHIPARKLSGDEASGLPKDCWELDPASIPPEALTIDFER